MHLSATVNIITFLIFQFVVWGCQKPSQEMVCDFEYIRDCSGCFIDTLKSDNGKVEMIISKKNGLKHGRVLSWWPNGQLSADNYYKEDKMHGPQKMWDQNGKIIGNSIWMNGKLVKTNL